MFCYVAEVHIDNGPGMPTAGQRDLAEVHLWHDNLTPSPSKHKCSQSVLVISNQQIHAVTLRMRAKRYRLSGKTIATLHRLEFVFFVSRSTGRKNRKSP